MSNAKGSRRAAKAFANLPADVTARAGQLIGLRLRAFYGLRLAADAGLGRVSLDDLSAGLDAIGIALSPLQLRNTLTPAVGEGQVVRRREGDEFLFGLTQDGDAALKRSLGGGLEIMTVVAGKPLTARSDISTVLAQQRGEVRLTDPFYGSRMAQLIAELTAATAVRVLTAQCGHGEPQASALGTLRDLMKEHPKVQVRITNRLADIAHDRYVLSADEFVLIGHGLKDIGGRDSFIVRLPRSILGGIALATEQRFDGLWQMASPV